MYNLYKKKLNKFQFIMNDFADYIIRSNLNAFNEKPFKQLNCQLTRNQLKLKQTFEQFLLFCFVTNY